MQRNAMSVLGQNVFALNPAQVRPIHASPHKHESEEQRMSKRDGEAKTVRGEGKHEGVKLTELFR